MRTRFNKLHPALKHAGYSATTLLPGENAAEFDKLRRDLIAEFGPVGVLEEDIVLDLARLSWRKRNLGTFRIAQLAKERRSAIYAQHFPASPLLLFPEENLDSGDREERCRAANQQAHQELGELHALIDIGEPAEIEGLMKELDIKERLDSSIDRCLKRLLMVRGVKSLSLASAPVPTPQISASRKAS